MTSRQLRGALIGTLAGTSLLLPAYGDRRASRHHVEAKRPAMQAAGGTRSATYGNIRVEHYQHSHVNVKTGAGEFEGPGMVIRTLSTTQPTQFRLTADRVVGKQTQEGKKTYYSADLSGNIHYVIIRHTAKGERTVTGTAGRAAYDERAEQIRLMDGVSAQLTDPAALVGPGILHAGELVVPASQSSEAEGVYILSGSPDVNEIALTLREQEATAGHPQHHTFAGPLHLSHFRSGELELEHRARVVGEGATVEFTDTPNDTQGRLTANALDVAFARRLRHASAEGDVAYRLARHTRSGGVQNVEGTSGSATYDALTDQTDIMGNVVATITDPDTLLEPATVDAKSLRVRLLPADPAVKGSKRPYHLEIVGIPGHAKLKFKPKPPPPPAVKPGAPVVAATARPAAAAPQVALGTLEIDGFRSGVWDTGRSLEFTGPDVTFVSSDPDTHSFNRLISSRLAVEFAKETVPSRAEASGGVRYHIEQPSELKDAQKVDGTASRVVYTTNPKTQRIQLEGPYTIKLTGADGEPSTYTGTPDDRVSFDFLSGTLDMQNPDRGGSATVAVRTLAKAKSEKPDKAPSPKRP